MKRSSDVAPLVRQLAVEAQQGTAARGFVVPANAKVEQYLHAYHTGKPKEINLLSAPPGNRLQLTAAMHVSGHTNEADKFATDPTETFTITVTDPNGKTFTEQVKMGGKPGAPVYSKAIDIEFDVSKKGNYTVDIAPISGVWGYIEGRRYNLHVGKENFFQATSPGPNYDWSTDPYPFPIDELDYIRNM